MRLPSSIARFCLVLSAAAFLSSCKKEIVEAPLLTITVTTLAGSGSEGSADGTGTAALFSSPRGIAVGADGSLYVADEGNSRIRKIELK